MKVTIYDSKNQELKRCRATVTLSVTNLLELLSKTLDGDTARPRGRGLVNDLAGLIVYIESDDEHYAIPPKQTAGVSSLRRILEQRDIVS